MKYIPWELEAQVARAARNFPAVILTGLRRAGKTMLLRRRFTPAMAAPMQRLAGPLRKQRPHRTTVELHLVHQSPAIPAPTRAVAPGVRASAWPDFVRQL